MSAEFFQTPMGRHFYEGTMPRIASALEKIANNMETFMKETEEAENTEDTSQFKDPYVHLKIPDTDLTVQAKLEGEGVVLDVFQGDEFNFNNSIASVWKLYDEMATGEPAGEDNETV